MGLADELREQAGRLRSLTAALHQHLEQPDADKWSQDEVVETLASAREVLAKIEDGLDISPERPGFLTQTREGLEEARTKTQALADDKRVAALESLDRAQGAQRQDEPAEEDDATVKRAAVDPQFAGFGGQVTRGGGRGGGGGRDADAPGGSDGPDSTSLEDFFSRVGSSLVSAQRQLDQRSREYLSELDAAGAGSDMGTLYRIPKVSAELKFALEKVDKDGVNLLIHKQGSEASTLNQQSVQFEITAVPAPATTLEAVRRLAPHVDLMLDPGPRQKVFEALQGVMETLSPVEQAVLGGQQDRILVVDLGDESYLLMFGRRQTGAGPMIWLASLDPPLLTSMTEGLDTGDSADPRAGVAALQTWLDGLGSRQGDFLRGL